MGGLGEGTSASSHYRGSKSSGTVLNLRAPGSDAEIIFRSDFIAACSTVHSNDVVELENSTTSIVTPLPAGHCWSSNGGAAFSPSAILLANVHFPADTCTLSNDFTDVDTTLSKLNPYSNDPNLDLLAFFATRGVGVDDGSLTYDDVAIEL